MVQEFSPDELLGPLNPFEEKNAPPTLYIRGNTDLLKSNGRVSIVGSRNASKEGLSRASRLSKLLVKNEVVVVSGLAKGVDTASHTAAIDSGGSTFGVIGTAIDKCYPAANRSLQEKIATEYLLISQFAPGERTYPSSFTQRNRTMALISDATVIVEAGEKSGTIHQGWEAIRLGRPLFIMKSLVDSNLQWVRDMMSYGALMLSNDTVDDLLDVLPPRVAEEVDVFAF